MLVLGGGGGASRTGIKNKLRLYHVGDDRSLQLLDELELANGEDAPMSMASHTKTSSIICGVNSTMEKIGKGQNENCRVFSVEDQKLELLNTKGTIPPDDIEDYQKVTVLSPDGSMLAVASSHDFSLLSFPSLTPVAEPIHLDKEIYDATFSATTLVIATTINLLVYALPMGSSIPSQKGKGKSKAKKGKSATRQTSLHLELMKTIELPATLGAAAGGTFRAVRYHPLDSKIIYTVVNTSSPRSRKSKTTPRQAFVCKWNTDTWTVEKTRKVGDRQITCVDVSDDGRLIGFGSSDLSIGLLDTTSFSSLLAILKAHEFPLTTITFNPTSTLLVSGSADHSVRIVSVPQTTGGWSWGPLLFILLTLIIVLIAFAAQRYLTLYGKI